jgi:hypothetical protein
MLVKSYEEFYVEEILYAREKTRGKGREVLVK